MQCRVDQLYSYLAAGPTPDCDHILSAGLDHAEPAWQTRIIDVLSQRGHDASLAALIAAFDRLPDHNKQNLLAAPDRLPAALGLALKTRREPGRLNALTVFEMQMPYRQAYLLPDALRDPSAAVRARAAGVLRGMAAGFLTLPRPLESETAAREAYRTERRQLAQAAAETFRTFELHHRVEALEVALWFAADVGEPLWSMLANHRARAGVVVAERIDDWTHPSMAWFLVRSLKEQSWKHIAVRMLSGFDTPQHLIELMHCAPLLGDTEIAKQLAGIKTMKCLAAIREGLSALPEALRPLAPRWIATLGIPAADKVRRLSNYMRSPDPHVHRAAIYALANLDDDDAVAILRRLSVSSAPLAVFARWVTAARDAGLVRPEAAGAESRAATKAQRAELPIDPQLDKDFAPLWQACRRTTPTHRGELIETIREHLDVWKRRLRACFQSPDPRDRILALQIVSTPDLALQYRKDIQNLSDDQVEGIRRLAATLLRTASSQGRLSAPPPEAVMTKRNENRAISRDTVEAARLELEGLLSQLGDCDDAGMDAELVTRVRSLLRKVHEPIAGAAAGSRDAALGYEMQKASG